MVRLVTEPAPRLSAIFAFVAGLETADANGQRLHKLPPFVQGELLELWARCQLMPSVAGHAADGR